MIIQGDTIIIDTKDVYSIVKSVSYNSGNAIYLIEAYLKQNPNEECFLGVWSTAKERDSVFENLAYSWGRNDDYFKV